MDTTIQSFRERGQLEGRELGVLSIARAFRPLEDMRSTKKKENRYKLWAFQVRGLGKENQLTGHVR